MKLFIDADASPVTKIATQIAEKVGIPLVLVCDTSHILYSDYGEVIVVSKGMDAADFALINRVDQGDIIITGDYGVAAMSLAKNFKGEISHEELPQSSGSGSGHRYSV